MADIYIYIYICHSLAYLKVSAIFWDCVSIATTKEKKRNLCALSFLASMCQRALLSSCCSPVSSECQTHRHKKEGEADSLLQKVTFGCWLTKRIFLLAAEKFKTVFSFTCCFLGRKYFWHMFSLPFPASLEIRDQRTPLHFPFF